MKKTENIFEIEENLEDNWTEEIHETMLELKEKLDLPTEEVERTVIDLDKKEKRKYERYEIDVPISVNTENRIIETWTKDISYSGCFIKTNAPYAIGDIIKLNITTEVKGIGDLVHGDYSLTPITAIVRWQRTNSNMSQEFEGMGVEFINLTPAQKNEIEKILLISETETYIT